MFKELKKHICVILVIIMIGLNSYNITKNTKHCNSNAQATITLSYATNTIANALSGFAKGYVNNRLADTKRLMEVFGITVQNGEHIIAVGNVVAQNIKNDTRILELIDGIHKKPSYEYLKSVTVFIEGEEIFIKQNPNLLPSYLDYLTSKWVGTGVVVKMDKDFTYILTNNHVAGGGRLALLFINNQEKHRYPAFVVARHPTQDLAIIKVKGLIPGKQVVKGLSFPSITEKVYTVGHSLARPFMYGEGIFAGTIIEHDIYQLPCIGGQSGSGVFNKNGELLGLVYSVSGAQMNWNVAWDFTRANAVKGIYVKEFIEEHLND